MIQLLTIWYLNNPGALSFTCKSGRLLTTGEHAVGRRDTLCGKRFPWYFLADTRPRGISALLLRFSMCFYGHPQRCCLPPLASCLLRRRKQSQCPDTTRCPKGHTCTLRELRKICYRPAPLSDCGRTAFCFRSFRPTTMVVHMRTDGMHRRRQPRAAGGKGTIQARQERWDGQAVATVGTAERAHPAAPPPKYHVTLLLYPPQLSRLPRL